MPSASARRRPSVATDSRGKLSRDQVVDAALELADRDGIEALTLRKLALALGVTPMALYWHVADKEALLDALGERMFAGVELPEPVDDWYADLCAVTSAMVAGLRHHPGVAPLAVSTILTSEPGVRLAERVLSRLCDAGFSDSDAADIGAYLLHAIVVLLTALFGAAPEDQGQAHAERMRRKEERLYGLPADSYPVVARLAPRLVRCEEPDEFVAQGVDLLMLGIKGLAEAATDTR